MKKIISLLLIILQTVTISAQIKTLTEEEIRKDKNFLALQAELKPFEDKLAGIMQEYQQAPAAKKNDPNFQAAIEKRYSEGMDEIVKSMSNFISKQTNSYISLVVLNELSSIYSGSDHSYLLNLYQKLTPALKSTDFGKHLGTRLNSVAKTAIGAVAPDFTQNDPKDKPIKLSDFRGKYVLIDFWASWCGPCRKENPFVVKAYSQFKNKNFEILGVSLDNPGAKTAWVNAIEKDNLTWPQVSDLKGFNNDVAALYGVESIPQNYLIDPKGVIIAKNLRGNDLIKKLSEILK